MTGTLIFLSAFITGNVAAILALCVVSGVALLSALIGVRLYARWRKLEDNHQQFQAIFDTMADGVIILDADQNILHVNSAASGLLGLSASNPTGQRLWETFEVILPDGRALPADQWHRLSLAHGEFVKNQELKLRRKDTGETSVVEIDTSPIRNHDGKVKNIVVTCRDVTQSRQLDAARVRLAAIVESSEDAIIGKDLHGIVTSWNKSAERIFGYTAQEIVGMPILNLLPPGYEQEETDILARIGRGEMVDHIETVRRCKSGKQIHVSLTISPIRDASGKVVGASKIARDISERRQLQQQLQQSQKMEAIGQLTGGIAHDFNNLLTIVLGNLELLESLVGENEDAQRRIQVAHKSAIRGAELTRSLLAFASQKELKPSIVRIEQSIQSVIDLASQTFGPEIEIATRFVPSIPDILVDRTGLESALLNLAVNARDAMPRGGSLIFSTSLCSLDENHRDFRAEELDPGEYVCISISDTGDGMTPDVLEHVFEPFYTTKPVGKGTGLGLAMVYGFVKQSGGTIKIHSEPNRGTTVLLYLPLSKESRPHSPKPNQAAQPGTFGGTILVVDDEPEIGNIALQYLEEMGYKAFTATDGGRALEVLARVGHIDLLLTDIMMPGGLSGVDLAHMIRRLSPGVQVIYSSGFAPEGLATRSVNVDAPLLCKPFRRVEFESAVRRAAQLGVDRSYLDMEAAEAE